MSYQPRGTQHDVIASTAPVIVVSGGAGTGKTTTSVAAARAHLERADQHRNRMLRAAAIADQRIRLPAPDRVLFLSFSRTAVTQILDRAGSVIGDYGPRLEVATFHGFAWRIITSFGAHRGYPPPQTVLGSADAAVPGAPAGLTYDDLIPAAQTLLTVPTIADHYAARYGMVICDEFQDTDTHEWAFLRAITPHARMMLLGDLHQCIYQGFKPVNPTSRIAEALALPGAIEIPLPAASFRDPTGILPAAAEAARDRRFNDPAIACAAASGRLTVTRIRDGAGYDEVIHLTRQARRAGHTVSIFTHTNAATADLSDALIHARITHEQVGFGEAYGAAIAAQSALVRYGLGDDTAPVRRGLAVYITANLRKKKPPPPLIGQLLAATNPQMEHVLGRLSADLRAAAGDTTDLTALAGVVADAYQRIGRVHARETWTRAAHRTRVVLQTSPDRSVSGIAAALDHIRNDTLVGDLAPRQRTVQVMNLHQTKGREADTTILLLNPDEWHGREQEPYPSGSRLLYVVMTRARHTAHLVTPDVAHGLWQPLVDACTPANA